MRGRLRRSIREVAAAAERGPQQAGVEPGRDAGGRDADMADEGKQRQRAGDVDGHRDAGEDIGVRVSSRAKKPGWKIFWSTKAGSPAAKAASASAVASVSAGSKAPRSNSTCTIGPG
jgi:hypothetical protein